MALSKKDINLIKEMMSETLKPDFDRIDKRFDRLENRMTDMGNTLSAAFREIVNDIYDLHPSKDEFNKLEGRVTNIEQEIN